MIQPNDIRTLPDLRRILEISPKGSRIHLDPSTLDARAAAYLDALIPQSIQPEGDNLYRIMSSDGVTNRIPTCLGELRRIVDRLPAGSWLHLIYDGMTRQARNQMHRYMRGSHVLTQSTDDPHMYLLDRLEAQSC